MTIIIDRTNEPVRHKFGKDKARFLRRIREAVRKSINNKIAAQSITDYGSGSVKVPIPKKVTTQPIIHHEQGPNFKRVFPGNVQNIHRMEDAVYDSKTHNPSQDYNFTSKYDVGDVVPTPKKGGGGGGGSGEGDGDPNADDSEDDFIWLSEEEYLDIYFEGRSLPDMTKLHNDANKIIDRQRAGHTSKGPSHKLDERITEAKRRGDEMVLNKSTERQITKNLLEQYQIYAHYDTSLPEIDFSGKAKSERQGLVKSVEDNLSQKFSISSGHAFKKNPTLSNLFSVVATLKDNMRALVTNQEHETRLDILESRLPDQIKARSKAGKFQDRHMTYHYDDDVPKPSAKAVMVCKMDVSGSMSQEDKNIAKTFFALLHKFIKANYDETEVVFISHTTTAEEVDEEEFFYGTRTGGTIVSSCLKKEMEIIKERYPVSEWNIYSAQASDGDNWGSDNAVVEDLMRQILPIQQASYFMEIRHPAYRDSELHETYKQLAKEFGNLKTANVYSPKEAVAAFENFFPVGGNEPTQKPSLG